MKFIKNKILTSTIVACTLPVSFACMTSITSCSTTKYYHDLHTLVPYLHYIEYDDYVVEENPIYDDSEIDTSGFACSCIRNGNLFGRNLDFYYDETPYFVIRVAHNDQKNRLASVGVTLNKEWLEKDIVAIEDKGVYDSSLDVLPNRTCDGINECGVVCAYNVCCIEDAGKVDFRKNDETDLNFTCTVRYLLDNAHTAKEGVELLKKRNIYIDKEYTPYNFHIMLADKDETYVIEFYQDKAKGEQHATLHIKPKGKNSEEGDDFPLPIMTNFYVNMDEDCRKSTWSKWSLEAKTYEPLNEILNMGAQGTERFKIIKDLYPETNNFAGMYETLKSVWMSNIYPTASYANWPSEDVWQHVITDDGALADWEKSDDPDWDGEGTPGYQYLYYDYHDVMRRQARDEGREKDIWITNHTSIFNIVERSMWIVPEEHYSLAYTFKV